MLGVIIILIVLGCMKRLKYRDLLYTCIPTAYVLSYLSLKGRDLPMSEVEILAWTAINGCIVAVVSYVLARLIFKKRLAQTAAEDLAAEAGKHHPPTE
ncbi:MAG: hypothetical protein V7641_3626 [Blastocatellia bacterium]